jgi:hypothetical protein
VRWRAVVCVAAGLATVCGASPARAQRDALTLPRNLAELVSEAHVVVEGQVLSVTLETHPQLKQLTTVVVTLRVDEALKGPAGESYTFRQAVLDPRDLRDKMGYRPGQNVLLLLIRPNQYGLSSPAGFEQGRFRVAAGADGKLHAANRFGNAGLFRDLPVQMQARGLRVPAEAQDVVARAAAGPVPLAALKSLIRTLAGKDAGNPN